MILSALMHAAPAIANPSSDDGDYPGDSDDSFYGGDMTVFCSPCA